MGSDASVEATRNALNVYDEWRHLSSERPAESEHLKALTEKSCARFNDAANDRLESSIDH